MRLSPRWTNLSDRDAKHRPHSCWTGRSYTVDECGRDFDPAKRLLHVRVLRSHEFCQLSLHAGYLFHELTSRGLYVVRRAAAAPPTICRKASFSMLRSDFKPVLGSFAIAGHSPRSCCSSQTCGLSWLVVGSAVRRSIRLARRLPRTPLSVERLNMCYLESRQDDMTMNFDSDDVEFSVKVWAIRQIVPDIPKHQTPFHMTAVSPLNSDISQVLSAADTSKNTQILHQTVQLFASVGELCLHFLHRCRMLLELCASESHCVFPLVGLTESCCHLSFHIYYLTTQLCQLRTQIVVLRSAHLKLSLQCFEFEHSRAPFRLEICQALGNSLSFALDPARDLDHFSQLKYSTVSIYSQLAATLMVFLSIVRDLCVMICLATASIFPAGILTATSSCRVRHVLVGSSILVSDSFLFFRSLAASWHTRQLCILCIDARPIGSEAREPGLRNRCSDNSEPRLGGKSGCLRR
ncbi:hypothetical protein KC353_g72 [Hortaea werneckii]|nr:hypothetical protein KC353_g72 [Hortaea werneckii]